MLPAEAPVHAPLDVAALAAASDGLLAASISGCVYQAAAEAALAEGDGPRTLTSEGLRRVVRAEQEKARGRRTDALRSIFS